jgi:hypothetical protein
MFCSLLKAKLDIEAKVINLQKDYLELFSFSLRQTDTENNKTENAKKLLQEKIETVEKIVGEYKIVLNQHHQISAEIIEAKETAEELNENIDSLFELLQIEIPEELKHRQQPTEILTRFSIQPAFETSDEEEENKENSRSYQEEEELSDKENSGLNNSSDYFSPNIQIKKSIVADNDALYTPAVKSSSKLPLFKRNQL